MTGTDPPAPPGQYCLWVWIVIDIVTHRDLIALLDVTGGVGVRSLIQRLVAQLPAVEVDRVRAAVEDLDPLVVRIGQPIVVPIGARRGHDFVETQARCVGRAFDEERAARGYVAVELQCPGPNGAARDGRDRERPFLTAGHW